MSSSLASRVTKAETDLGKTRRRYDVIEMPDDVDLADREAAIAKVAANLPRLPPGTIRVFVWP